MPNILMPITEQFAKTIDQQHVIKGAEELIELILLLSHNFNLFVGAINGYIISNLFEALVSARHYLVRTREEQKRANEEIKTAQKKADQQKEKQEEEKSTVAKQGEDDVKTKKQKMKRFQL